jgi:hypothetical protein
MASSISVRVKDRLEGATTNNARRVAFRKIQAKANRIIFDSVKDTITMTLIMTAKDFMDTLVNLYER